MNRNSKRNQILIFQNNQTVIFKMECVGCGIVFEHESDSFDDETLGYISEEAAQEAYKEGWRNSTSKVFDHIGIHCPECHKNRNNPKYFEY
jgi:hypothetical protein